MDINGDCHDHMINNDNAGVSLADLLIYMYYHDKNLHVLYIFDFVITIKFGHFIIINFTYTIELCQNRYVSACCEDRVLKTVRNRSPVDFSIEKHMQINVFSVR